MRSVEIRTQQTDFGRCSAHDPDGELTTLSRFAASKSVPSFSQIYGQLRLGNDSDDGKKSKLIFHFIAYT